MSANGEVECGDLEALISVVRSCRLYLHGTRSAARLRRSQSSSCLATWINRLRPQLFPVPWMAHTISTTKVLARTLLPASGITCGVSRGVARNSECGVASRNFACDPRLGPVPIDSGVLLYTSKEPKYSVLSGPSLASSKSFRPPIHTQLVPRERDFLSSPLLCDETSPSTSF